ncbi:MAG: arylesterase [Moraxellaceae bacterium]|nr:MAG: arylesterase [Moraxellaceae bacterium]
MLFITLLPLFAHCAHAMQPTLLIMGDSLSAGYGIKLDEGWVNLLQQELTKKTPAKIVNASVSGETSSGGLTRLPALLNQHKPDIVIIELGGNDGLRGQPVKILQENLQTMINLSQKSGARVLLVGMQIPTNYGSRYTTQFKESYTTLAEKNKIALVPFLLEGVATHSELVQNDGIHPTAAAQPIIVKNVLPVLLPMIQQAAVK